MSRNPRKLGGIVLASGSALLCVSGASLCPNGY